MEHIDTQTRFTTTIVYQAFLRFLSSQTLHSGALWIPDKQDDRPVITPLSGLTVLLLAGYI